MSDPELAHHLLSNIMIAIGRIERRFEGVNSPDDFVADDFGIDRLDGITMMLIAMGEQIKRLDSALDFDLATREHWAAPVEAPESLSSYEPN